MGTSLGVVRTCLESLQCCLRCERVVVCHQNPGAEMTSDLRHFIPSLFSGNQSLEPRGPGLPKETRSTPAPNKALCLPRSERWSLNSLVFLNTPFSEERYFLVQSACFKSLMFLLVCIYQQEFLKQHPVGQVSG